ncbi:MAG: PEP-CTERM sorting domain-containing protein [Phycisphaerae bacterium]|jgi:hypothetical protein
MKLATVLSMLLATSAFAAPMLVVSPGPEAAVDAGGQVVLTISITNDGVNLNGYSLKASVPAGKVRVTGRTNLNGVITDPTDPNAVNKMLEAVNDLGYTGAFGSGTAAPDVPLMTLTLKLEPGVTIPPAIPITFTGSWNDVDFNEGTFAPTMVTLVPEPASMMLLAAGAAFFARRRRVA